MKRDACTAQFGLSIYMMILKQFKYHMYRIGTCEHIMGWGLHASVLNKTTISLQYHESGSYKCQMMDKACISMDIFSSKILVRGQPPKVYKKDDYRESLILWHEDHYSINHPFAS